MLHVFYNYNVLILPDILIVTGSYLITN